MNPWEEQWNLGVKGDRRRSGSVLSYVLSCAVSSSALGLATHVGVAGWFKEVVPVKVGRWRSS